VSGRRERYTGVATLAASIAIERTEEARRALDERISAAADDLDPQSIIDALVTFDDEIDMAEIEIPPTFDGE
jgi:hypothetical protein